MFVVLARLALNIPELPAGFITPLHDVTVIEGEEYEFVCETSKSDVAVKWFKREHEIISGMRQSRRR